MYLPLMSLFEPIIKTLKTEPTKQKEKSHECEN